MRDHQHRPHPNPSARALRAVPPNQTRALVRKQTLDEQQKSYQQHYPKPHFFARRPPG
ncbi:MAG: hypothetical protein U0794_08045 [Isosphaeraceae bacterium]